MTQESLCAQSLVPGTRLCWAVIVSAMCLLLLGRPNGPAAADEISSERAAAAQMVVAGRVLDTGGKPVADCQVATLVWQYRRSAKPEGHWPLGWHPGLSPGIRVSATGRTAADGRFSLTGPGHSPALPALGAVIIASAPGHGLTARLIDPVLPPHDVAVRLEPERVVRGRLVDAAGRPAAGVEIRIHSPSLRQDSQSSQKKDVEPGERKRAKLRPTVATILGNIANYMPPEGPFWPKPVVTDEQGRFLILGLGPGKATLVAEGGSVAPNRFAVEMVEPPGTEHVTLTLTSAPLVEGRVTEEGSGKPVPGARLTFGTGVESRTNKEGRYAARPFPGKSFRVVVHPPEGSQYLVTQVQADMAQKDRQELNLSLPVGVVVRGRVTEAGTGRPVAGARVQYRQRNANNPLLRKGAAMLPYINTLFLEEGYSRLLVSTLDAAISGPDGGFQLAVAPGPGHLFVLGPTSDYLHVETSLRELEGGKPGAFRYYPNAIIPLDLKPGERASEVKAELRRGVTIRGRVVGPDGKPAKRFMVLCRSYIPSGWHQWNNSGQNDLDCRDGRFELPGCDPDKPVTAYFFDEENKLGATADLSAKRGDGPEPVVQLQPCGRAVIRCVDLDGKPLAGYGNVVCFQFDPGTHEPPNTASADRPLEGNWFIWWFYKADAVGRATISNLIPGATYHIISQGGKGPWGSFEPYTLTEFTVKSGETRELRLVDWRVDDKPLPVEKK